MIDAFSGWPDAAAGRDEEPDGEREPLHAGESASSLARAARLLLVGGMDDALGIARGLARASHREFAVRRADAETLDEMRSATPGMVMVEVPVDIPNVLARLRVGQGFAPHTGLPVDALVGRTLAEVEQALILGTLTHCHGNRTLASTMLGISVRTMRNKLRIFIEDGIAVSPAL
jgi:hypothetical protein